MSKRREETLLSDEETRKMIGELARAIAADITHPEKRVIVGIRRGGAILAEILCEQLKDIFGSAFPMGFLDITFYRDDLKTVGPNPVVGATDLTMDIDDKRIILVDDVLFTGRTIRAALNALFDYGRPEIVDLMVLMDRGHRQLPIQPDYLGRAVETGNQDTIKLLRGADSRLSVVRRYL
ncbi:MAG: bifunctional pyr operon transcriptional regulator/uracil phosphoribosyltransferase PyrR [Magnetococcales bacterium]|nr:bifunctional pyr operon transcriptional regulator/uracil phosphoribosyltransferase PyrR [Magnetococcales bacterium]